VVLGSDRPVRPPTSQANGIGEHVLLAMPNKIERVLVAHRVWRGKRKGLGLLSLILLSRAPADIIRTTAGAPEPNRLDVFV
jgi:hypothetical protein